MSQKATCIVNIENHERFNSEEVFELSHHLTAMASIFGEIIDEAKVYKKNIQITFSTDNRAQKPIELYLRQSLELDKAYNLKVAFVPGTPLLD